MDTDQLRLFLDVAKAGSFASVASARGLSPSTVSRAVSALESELGVRLFHRTTRNMQLTEEGELFRARVQPVVSRLGDAVEELRDAGRPASGTVRISASVSFGQAVIAPLLADFRAAHPGVTVELLLSDRRVDLVAERIDVAVRHGALVDSSLTARKLADVRYRLVASNGYLDRRGVPDDPSQLADHDLITFPYPPFQTQWTLGNGTSEASIPIDPVATISSAAALRTCALGGMGIALLPDWLALEGLRTVLPNWRSDGVPGGSALWVVTPSRADRPKRVTTFIDSLRAAIPQGR